MSRYRNYHDSIALLEMRDGDRLFGNHNIGYRSRCNLQIPGQLSYDGSASIFHVYARTNVCRVPIDRESLEIARDAFIEGRDDDGARILLNEYRPGSLFTRLFDEWAHSAHIELHVDGAHRFELNLYDLFGSPLFSPDGEAKHVRNRNRLSPIVVSSRHYLSVSMWQAPSDELLDQLRRADITPTPLVWIHLETIESER